MAAEMVAFECVVAADRTRGIGKNNDLPWPKLPSDLQHFKRITSTAAEGLRNAVIMGRRTWDSVNQRALPRRLNIVVSRGAQTLPDGVLAATSLDDALVIAGQAPGIARTFLVGGGALYAIGFAHPRCAGIYYTRIDGDFGCDTHIPAIEPTFAIDPAWPPQPHHESGIDYVIEHWRRAGTGA